MKRGRQGLTLGEVLMSLSLMAFILVTSLLILQWALRGTQHQQGKTTAAFLAQRQMEFILDQEQPKSDTGSFEPPYADFKWTAKVQKTPDQPFLAVELTVQGHNGIRYTLYTQRCEERRSLLWRTANTLWRSNEDLHDEQVVFDDFSATEFSVSPDGKTLAFVQMEKGKPQVFSRPLDGLAPTTQLFTHPEGAREPRYSPDGKSLAFTSIENGYSQVFIYDLASGHWVNRSKEGHHEGAPAWTSDGEGLVVCRDGQALVLLKNGAETVLEENEEAWNATPEVSPDGKTLVFMSSRDGNPELYVMDLATQKKTRLTDHPDYDAEPHFSRDGKRILFSRKDEESDVSHLFTINPDGSGLTQLTGKKGGEDPCWHP